MPTAQGSRSGGGLSEYAARIGRTNGYISQIRSAAEVMAKTSYSSKGFPDLTAKHLYEVSRAPRERTVRNWLSRIDKDSKEARDKRIFAAWLACHTQQEIAEVEGIPHGTVPSLIEGFHDIGNLAESKKADARHATDFEPPLYNVWKQQDRTPG